MSGIHWFCITFLFTSHLETKHLPSCLLITAVWMDYFVWDWKKNQDSFVFFFFFYTSGSIFQIQSNRCCLWLQRYLPSFPALLWFGLSKALPGKYARAMSQGVSSNSWRLWISCHVVFSMLFKQQAQPTWSWSLIKFWRNVTPCPSCLCFFLVLTAKASVSVPEKFCLVFKVYALRKGDNDFSQATAHTLMSSFHDTQ